jgi:hypothetical protein
MNKYTVVYTAYGRYDTQMDEPTSRVEYIQGETLDKAIEGHIKHMKKWAIRDIIGEVVFLKGHVEQVDIGHGVGHQMNPTHSDVVITNINNSKINAEDKSNS